LQIQVLDDSTDETTAIALACVQRHRARGLDIELVHRYQRPGYKAGALAAALPEASGELIALFDADFTPGPDFLRQTVPHLTANPAVGFVQARWSHLNASYSPLTRAQALALDGHFVVEQTARQRSGWFFGFNGTAGLWRRACIEAAGGWQADTLCEDLDLSYRAQLAGWQGLYLPDVAAPAEIPPQLAAFKRQQARWAAGSIQVFRKLARPLAQAPRPPAARLEGLIHLGAYFCHPLMLLLLLLMLPLLWLGSPDSNPLRWLLPYLGLASVGPPLLYAIAQWQLHRDETGRERWIGRLLYLPLLVLIGTGIAVNNTLAVVRGLTQRAPAFRRTPKFHLEGSADRWQDKSYALPLDSTTIGELTMAAYALLTVAAALIRGHVYAVPFLLLYVSGFSLMAGMGLLQSWQRRPNRAAKRSSLGVSTSTVTPQIETSG